MVSSVTSSDHGALPSKGHLYRLMLLRVVVLCGAAAAVLFARGGTEVPFAAAPIWAVLFTMAILYAVTWWRLQRTPSISNLEFFLQILADVGALTLVLYFTGGAANPFTLLYLLPVSITAAALPLARYAWGMVAVTTACYTLLLLHTHLMPMPAGHAAGMPLNLHAVGMWAGFVMSSCLIVYFVVSMHAQLRERDRVLAEVREKRARDERLVELGTLAAGAAHELGTPLATMAVVASELEQDYAHDPDIAARAQILRQQVKRCKQSLSVLSANAGQAMAESGASARLDEFLRRLVSDWRGTRAPETRVKFALQASTEAPRIIVDRRLSQALHNIFNNAADVSPRDVEIRAGWNDTLVEIEVCDRGPGFDPMTSARVGTALFTTKGESGGLGIGLFLAYSTISRYGGRVDVFSRDGGGTRTCVVLDLQSILVPKEGKAHGNNSSGNGEQRDAALVGR